MTNYERITESADALADFLESLPVLDGPWDRDFQQRYCIECEVSDCGCTDDCPHQKERNNPGWWLTQEAGAREAD